MAIQKGATEPFTFIYSKSILAPVLDWCSFCFSSRYNLEFFAENWNGGDGVKLFSNFYISFYDSFI